MTVHARVTSCIIALLVGVTAGVMTKHVAKVFPRGRSLSRTPTIASNGRKSLTRASTIAQLGGEPASTAKEKVAASPLDAIAWALAVDDPDEQKRRVLAVARAWGETDPIAALQWVIDRDEPWQPEALEAALNGAAYNPKLLVKIGQMLLAADPRVGSTQGAALIGALGAHDEFDLAMQFATTAPKDMAGDWTTETFCLWAKRDPARATAAMRALADPMLRAQAFQALVDTLAADDPAALVMSASSLPVGENRAYLFREATRSWAERDPGSMANWLLTQPAGSETEMATATLLAARESPGATLLP